MARCETRQELEAKYGVPIGCNWGGESKFMTMYTLPATIFNWINTATGKPLKRIYLNRDMMQPLDQALNNVFKRGLIDQLKTFDGCFMVRPIRGVPNAWSIHSYGLAIDINAADNKLGEEPTMSPELVQCFKDAGFSWGGDFKRRDGMHMEYCGIDV
jgi:hypothetical protein